MFKVSFILLLTIAMYLVALLPLRNSFGIVVLVIACYLYVGNDSVIWQKNLLWLLIVPLAFWAATWRPEGFSYPLLMEYGNNDGEDRFSLYANISKGLVGLCLLVMLWPAKEQQKYRFALPWQLGVLLLSPLLVIASAIVLFDLQWQPKLLEQILIFGMANLLLTCVAEEAFLRLLLQQPIISVMQRWTKSRWLQEVIPLLLVTGIFVAIHSGVSGAAIWVYALAGFLYGLAYTLSKNILYPIVVHAMVNILHFSLLTYPV